MTGIVDVDGRFDSRDPGIRYLGKAQLQRNGEWHCLADVYGALCMVAVRMRFDTADHDTGDEDGNAR